MIEVIVRNSVSNGAVRYKGISKTSNRNPKFEASVTLPLNRGGYKKIYIGSFHTEAEAVQTRVDFITNLL